MQKQITLSLSVSGVNDSWSYIQNNNHEVYNQKHHIEKRGTTKKKTEDEKKL